MCACVASRKKDNLIHKINGLIVPSLKCVLAVDKMCHCINVKGLGLFTW